METKTILKQQHTSKKFNTDCLKNKNWIVFKYENGANI